MNTTRHRKKVWPVYFLSLPAAVAIWAGWVELGGMAGFGIVKPLPGIADDFTFNSAITLPIGMEAYAAYALYAWLAMDGVTQAARRYAGWSALASFLFGMTGQITYHYLAEYGDKKTVIVDKKLVEVVDAPVEVVVIVACVPVVVLGMGALLAHLLRQTPEEVAEVAPEMPEDQDGIPDTVPEEWTVERAMEWARERLERGEKVTGKAVANLLGYTDRQGRNLLAAVKESRAATVSEKTAAPASTQS